MGEDFRRVKLYVLPPRDCLYATDSVSYRVSWISMPEPGVEFYHPAIPARLAT